jgi:hypothetical protein
MARQRKVHQKLHLNTASLPVDAVNQIIERLKKFD